MASSKLMTSSSASRKSDLTRRSSSTKPQSSISDIRLATTTTAESTTTGSMTVDGLLRNVYGGTPVADNTLLDAQITLLDAGSVVSTAEVEANGSSITESVPSSQKTVEDVWREIVQGANGPKQCKEEATDEMMTLEDFLAKAGAVDEEDVKVVPSAGGIFSFDPIPQTSYPPQNVEGSVLGFGNGVEVVQGRGKRRAVLEPLDKAAQQRQRRMIKNRESAARSRERKQAYQVELESLAVRLEEENQRLLQEKEERAKERYKQLMEKVVPVVEKRRPPRTLRRVCSLQW
ncbi:Basic-leucine zipper domain [Dillenia turbinata]|uniref:Basic-leucine zipper domain n=1 Tax=Dillenia turbinata TaxID=194707 RepID=A0AAN8W389_9MAGN